MRPVVTARPAVVSRSVAPGAIVTPRPTVLPRTVLRGACRRRRQRLGCRGLSLGRGAAERRTRRGHDPGRFCTHAEDSSTTRGQDLEIEIVELRAERLAGKLE